MISVTDTKNWLTSAATTVSSYIQIRLHISKMAAIWKVLLLFDKYEATEDIWTLCTVLLCCQGGGSVYRPNSHTFLPENVASLPRR